MGKVAASGLGALIGGLIAAIAVLVFFGWGHSISSTSAQIDPSRSDYIDFLLTVVTVLLGAVGLAVTIGAVVIGMVALKTLGEIKGEAVGAARSTVDTWMVENLPSRVEDNVDKALSSMEESGELVALFEIAAVRTQNGGDFQEQKEPGELD